MEQQFRDAFAQLARLTPIEASLADPKGRQRIANFAALLEQMRADMETSYLTHLQLTIGFNSLDGD